MLSFVFGRKVRMGTDKDPEHEDKTGSNPLRQGCPTEEDLRKGFSLVYLSRTVSQASGKWVYQESCRDETAGITWRQERPLEKGSCRDM